MDKMHGAIVQFNKAEPQKEVAKTKVSSRQVPLFPSERNVPSLNDK